MCRRQFPRRLRRRLRRGRGLFVACVVCPTVAGLAVVVIPVVLRSGCISLLLTKSLSIESHFKPSCAVETHGLKVFLPRLCKMVTVHLWWKRMLTATVESSNASRNRPLTLMKCLRTRVSPLSVSWRRKTEPAKFLCEFNGLTSSV